MDEVLNYAGPQPRMHLGKPFAVLWCGLMAGMISVPVVHGAIYGFDMEGLAYLPVTFGMVAFFNTILASLYVAMLHAWWKTQRHSLRRHAGWISLVIEFSAAVGFSIIGECFTEDHEILPWVNLACFVLAPPALARLAMTRQIPVPEAGQSG